MVHLNPRVSVSYASAFSDSARRSLLIVRERPREPRPPRLLDRVRQALRARNYSRRTEESYVAWIRRYIVFFAANQIVVRGGKGDKDHVTMLPAIVRADLATHLQEVRTQHDADLANGAGAVELPTAQRRKEGTAARQWVWQGVFPATRIYRDQLTGELRRHHLHESVLQRAVKAAAESRRLSPRSRNLRPRTQDREIRGSQSCPVDARPAGIGGKDPQQLPRNTDRPILWPNCS